MTREGPPELPSDIRDLLSREEGTTDAVEPRRQAELFARVAKTVNLPGGGAGTSTAGAAAGKVAVLKAAGLLLVGAAATSSAIVAVRPRNAEVRTVDGIVERTMPPPSSFPSPSPIQTAVLPLEPSSTATAQSNDVRPVLRASTSAPAPEESGHASLARERAILENARSALARGDGPSALAAIAAHERAFSTGRMAEEREVLAVQSLVLAERHDDALARARRFHARFPKSLFAPIVDAALGP